MSESWVYPHNIPNDVEFYETEEELTAALDKVSPAIGWIVIEFNSLEDSVLFCMKELMSQSEAQDSFVYALTANMGYSGKVNALLNIYGEILERCDYVEFREPLRELDTKLSDAARRRNYYAHADWIGISRTNLVSVKMKADRKGIRQLYRTFDAHEIQTDLECIREATSTLIQFDETFNEKMRGQLP